MFPPAGVRRYLGFTKLSTAAVQAVTRVLDRDESFRSHVAATVDEHAVGRAAWLWLNRPEGWRHEFAELEEQAAEEAATETDKREERDARRRLAAARAAAEKATAVATERAQEAADIRAELADEHAHRRKLEKRVAELEAELEDARTERAAAVRQLKQVEANLARRAAEAKEANARLRELEQHGVRAADDRPAAASNSTLDVAALRQALATAATTSTQLTEALLRIVDVVETTEPATGPTSATGATDEAKRPATTDSDGDDPAPDEPYRRPPPELSSPYRQPLTLPGGIRDDSAEAVDSLLRAPGVWLLVDGYNISMVGWPDVSVADQRRRLVTALGEIAARTGASAKVVFDGAATEPWPLPQPARHLVSVMFSPAGVEADDVLIDLVARLPPARPVVVASSDNRVRDGVRRLGANLVHARQLLAVLRR